jgi:hypothetical protein
MVSVDRQEGFKDSTEEAALGNDVRWIYAVLTTVRQIKWLLSSV